MGCVPAYRRRRIEVAIGDDARIEWHDSFTAIANAVARIDRAAIVILGVRDSDGMMAGTFAAVLAARPKVAAVVLHATHQEMTGGALSTGAITDVLIADETDRPLFVRSVLLNARKRIAAARVAIALRTRMSGCLALFAETALRHPSCATVEAVSRRLGVHRQTAASWCRQEKFLKPEELLMWSRVLLVAALLEETDRSAAALACDLEFPSPVSLRNQLKRYTGMTALEIRAAGLDAMLEIFDREVASRRSLPPRAEAVPFSA